MMNVGQIMLRGIGEGRPAFAEQSVRRIFLLHFRDLPGNRLPLLGAQIRGVARFLLFRGKAVEFLADLELLEFAQGTQAHVEDGFSLIIRQFKAANHLLLRLIFLADDADDLIDIKVGDQHAAKNFETALDFAEAMARATNEDVLAVLQPLLQNIAQRKDIRHLAVRKAHSYSRESAFQAR